MANKTSKNKKRRLLLLSLSVIPAVAFASVVPSLVPSTSNTSSSGQDLSPTSSSLDAIETTTNAQGSYSINATADTVDWWGTLSPSEVTSEQIRGLISQSNNTSGTTITFNVTILPITEANLAGGYVNFLVVETAVTSGTNPSATPAYVTAPSATSGTGTGNYASTDSFSGTSYEQLSTANKIWSTQQFSGLLTSSQYQYVWVSDSEIETFIQSINSSGTTLTEELVYLNMLDHSYNVPNLATSGTTYTTITLSNTSSTYGVWSITVTANGNTTNNFNGETTLTKTIRGVNATATTGTTMELNYNSNIGSITLDSSSSIFNMPSGATTVSDLSASEFASPLGDASVLLSVLASGTGLDGNPIVWLEYAGGQYKLDGSGLVASSSADSSASSGIETSSLTIDSSSIQTSPNDSDGSLSIVFDYTYLNVYTGNYVTTTGSISFAAGTFRTESTAPFVFSWKTIADADVYNLGTSFDVVNQFYRNQTDEEFVIQFSNLFFEGTEASYTAARTVTIGYTNSTTIEDAGGNWVASGSSQPTSVTISITFTDLPDTGDGVTTRTFTTDIDFGTYRTINQSSTSALTLSWYSNAAVLANNPTYVELSPSNIVSRLTSETSYADDEAMIEGSPFFSVSGITTNSTSSSGINAVISYLADDTNGTITVYLLETYTNGTTTTYNLFTQLFTGFVKSDTANSITSFTWIPQTEVSQALLAIPLDQVTKTDVISLYLNNISLFANQTLDESNVNITPITNTTSPYLNVQVVLSSYNQSSTSVTTSDQTFYTNIRGFASVTSSSDSEFDVPKDYTALISVTASSIICVLLASILIAMIARRARVRKFADPKKNKPKKIKD